ncbi:unnamed protein product [Callosobruchus maculatus]|uniref:CAF1B/HIR1 beta-propeller domain-containing protein n=1 Tax=Callosobruchus maculatus TaxID=64391 RepID=A0A653DTL9_CALMS|nr:unnamed protein product [Callosobruchus maculatus]
MKCTIPEISWHNREPVLSVDIHPVSNEFYKLASGGGDSHVLIWQMTITENGAVKQEVVSDLTRHQRAVNCVRWSPDGKYLASADDDANIIVWQLKTDNVPLLEGDTENKETWIVYKVLRGHKEDIYDLSWSVDGTKLFSGSVDNTAVLWDLAKGQMQHILTDHKGFVQGVSWDPKNQYLSSISTDRICRLFDISGKHVKARIQKGRVPVPPNHFLSGKEVRYFHDDTFKSFFRRLEFSPDGSLLLVPSGRMEADDCKKVLCATLMFTMDNYTIPAAILPIPNQCTTVVRFCPVLFTLREDGPEPMVKLPYRMVFAVGTDHDIILYDTQQKEPFARFHEIHYTRLTDLTWSQDGLLLTASSTDGFCALVTFDVGELGTVYVKEDNETEETQIPVEVQEKVEIKDQANTVIEKKRPSFLEKWALNTPPKKKAPKRTIETEDIIEIQDEESDAAMDQDETEELSQEMKNQIRNLLPSRATSTTAGNSSQDAKPIEVRKRPREEVTADAKPIEVRKKPRADDGNQKDKTHDKSIASQGVNMIEVRKKPRSDMDGVKDKSKTSDGATQKTMNAEVKDKDKQVETVVLNDTSDEDSSDESEDNEETEKLSQNIKDEISNLLPTRASFKGVGAATQDGLDAESKQKPKEQQKEKINILVPRKKSALQCTRVTEDKKDTKAVEENNTPQKEGEKEEKTKNGTLSLGNEDVKNLNKTDTTTVKQQNGEVSKTVVISDEINSKKLGEKDTEAAKTKTSSTETKNDNTSNKIPKITPNSNIKTKTVEDNATPQKEGAREQKTSNDSLSSETENGLCSEDPKKPNKSDTTTDSEVVVISDDDENDSGKLGKKDTQTAKTKTLSTKTKNDNTPNKTPKNTPTARKTKTVEEDITPQKNGTKEQKTKNDTLRSETENGLCTEDLKKPNKTDTTSVKQQNGEDSKVIVISNEINSEKFDKKDTETTKTKSSSTKKKKDNTPNKTPKTTPKARKKLCSTPPTNSLLSFLKQSGSKKKSIQASTVINLTDGDEARDGWNHQKGSTEEDKDNLGVSLMEEDHTEDFCLRLEDTQDAETDKEKPEALKNSDYLNIVKVEEKKVPRRIPLITLSSPKSKKTSNTNA